MESWVRTLTLWNVVCPAIVALAMILSLAYGCSIVNYMPLDIIAFVFGWSWLIIVPLTCAAALIINRKVQWKPGNVVNWIILILWLLSVVAVSFIYIMSAVHPTQGAG